MPTVQPKEAEVMEEKPKGIRKFLLKIGPTFKSIVVFLKNVPETINETHNRRVGVHNIVLIVFCYTVFVMSFMVLTQDMKESDDHPIEISPFSELLDGYSANYNPWYLEKMEENNWEMATTTEAN